MTGTPTLATPMLGATATLRLRATAALMMLAAVTPTLLAPAAASAQTRALVGATVIDGTGAAPLTDAVVLIDGDRITCVGTAAQCPVPGDAERTNLQGRFITPGLVDAHVHFSQTGWLDGRPDGLTAPDVFPYAETSRRARENPGRWHRSYLCTGVTAVYDVGGHPWTTQLPDLAENDPDAAHVRAAGPLITHADVPALQVDDEHYTFLPMGSVDEALQSVHKVVDMGATSVKVWYVGSPPSRWAELDEIVMAIGEATRRAGLDLIVHATGLREAKTAVRAGAALLVHSVQNQLVDEEFLDLVAEQGTIYAPTLTVGENWARAMVSVVMDAPEAVDDPNGCVDHTTVGNVNGTAMLRDYLPERLQSGGNEYAYRRFIGVGRTQAIMAENLRRVHASGAVVATATDAGNPMTLHGPSMYGEMETMQSVGLSPMEVIVMSTRNGAMAMGRLGDFGTLEAGKIADLIVLTEDPSADVAAFRSLTHVMRMGVMHDQKDLAYRPVS
jgi:imidazolonepropionase-like amidohydrolase